MELTLKHWEEWIADPALQRTQPRSRAVHGLMYASFVAASKIFDMPKKPDLDRFKQWCIHHAIRSSGEVVEQVNVNVVWQFISNAFKAEVFGTTPSEVGRFFKATYKLAPHPPGAQSQSNRKDNGPEWQRIPHWRSYTLYMDYNGVWDRLMEHWRHIGETPPMTLRDFGAQMASHPYFLKSKRRTGFYQRLHGHKSGVRVWAFALDYHPMGYQEMSDEAVLESYQEAASEGGSENWADPRKGELFLICYALEAEAKKGQEDQGNLYET